VGMLTGDFWDGPGVIANIVPVTLGNVIGGSVFVGLVYYVVYIRPATLKGE